MKKNKTKIIIGAILATLIAIGAFMIQCKNQSVEALSKYGSRGSEVTRNTNQTKKMGLL